MERHVFNRQPARAILIDLQAPMDMTTCVNIQQALSHVLSILVHLIGPSRVPLFSLSVLHSYTECLFPLQPVKGNSPRVQGALGELRSFASELAVQRRGHTRSSFLEGIQESLAQFHRLLQSLKQGGQSSTVASSYPSQIEVIILTAQNEQTVRHSIERVIENLDLENLKKILAVCINDPEKLVEQALQDQQDSEASLSQSLSQLVVPNSPSDLSVSVLDLTTCTNDMISLENLFKTWFHDCSTDSEHLQIVLPPSLSSNQTILLKCDLHERMLHPSTLSTFTKNFTGSSTSTNSTGRGSSTQSSSTVPIYKLRAVGTVACSGICESVVYGTPYVVRPTACWKLDWEELESNQQNFQGLCYHLKDRNQAVLMTTDVLSSSTNAPLQALGHYILFPSSSLSSLLLKTVVCNELLLPVELGESDEHPSSETVDTLGESLAKLDYYDTYNPLMTNSQLYNAISATVTRKGSGNSTSGGQRGGRSVTGSRGGQTKRKAPAQSQRVHIGNTPLTSNGTGTTFSGRSLSTKRPRIMRGGFVYGGDHI